MLKILNATENFPQLENQQNVSVLNELRNLINDFTLEFNNPYFIKLYIHMRDSHLSNNYYMQEKSIKYHTIIESLNQPIDTSKFENEICNYNIDNSIQDANILQNVKYSYSPISIIIWCLLCSKVNVIELVKTERKHKQKAVNIWVHLLILLTLLISLIIIIFIASKF